MLSAEQTAQLDELYGSQSSLHELLIIDVHERQIASGELPLGTVDVVRAHAERLAMYDREIDRNRARRPYRSVDAVAAMVAWLIEYGDELRSTVNQRALARSGGSGSDISRAIEARAFATALRAVRSIPNMTAAVERFQAGRRRDLLSRAERPLTSYRHFGQVVHLGEICGTRQVVEIRPGGGIDTVDLQTQETRTWTVSDWLETRRLIEIDRRVRGTLSQNPFLQFGYGFAEGMGTQARDTIEMFANIRQILGDTWTRVENAISRFWQDPINGLADAGRGLRDLFGQLLERIWEWGREFVNANTPQQARMAGRILGAFVFEIVSDIVTGMLASTVATIRRALPILRRARGLGGLPRIAGVLDDGLNALERIGTRVVSGPSRALLEASGLILREAGQVLARAYHVADGLLEVGGEMLIGSFRRVAQTGREAYVFVVEGARGVVVNLGDARRLPEGVNAHPIGIERLAGHVGCVG